jgi:hypothetical protein
MIPIGQISDGKTIMLLYWAGIHGPFARETRPPIRSA